MRLELDNLNAHVFDASDEELTWLNSYLSFEDPSAKFIHKADGSTKYNPTPKRRSLLGIGNTFPAGLVGKVKKAALQNNMLLPVLDRRVRPCVPLTWEEALVHAGLLRDPGGPHDLSNVWLHEHQVPAVDIAIQRTRGILDMPTGSGKTEVAVGIALRLGLTNTLFIAPEADLMHNAARRWEKRTGLTAGRIGDGWLNPLDGFTAATFQTLASRLAKADGKLLAYLRTVGCAIFDEVHTLPADMFYRTALQIPAYWRIGISGTPLARGDRKSLYSIAATGSIIYKVDTQLLITRGFISRPHIQMVPFEQTFDAAAWQEGEAKGIVDSSRRNKLIVTLASIAPTPGLVFVKLKKHGRVLTDMMRAAGLRVEFVWGEKNIVQRDEAVKRLINGQLDHIVCSVVFQTGTDIPEVRSMIIACGGKSEIATLQRIGRGMRIVRDDNGNVLKDEFYVFDVMDTEPKQHAGHTGNRWNARHSHERFKAYTGVGHEVVIKDVAVVDRVQTSLVLP